MKRTHLSFFVLLFLFVALLCSCEQECKHSNMSKNTVLPTCTEHGETVHTCNDCGYTYTSHIVEPKGHTFDKETVAGDCTKDGYTKYTCSCGAEYVSDYISATGHEYVDTVTYPDCTSGGYTTHKCKTCDYTYVSNHTDPEGHTLTSTVYLPTCTNEGYTLLECEKCEYTAKTDYIAPTGHKLTKTVIAPTCTHEGHTSFECENCDYSYFSDYTKPTGHNYSKTTTVQPNCTDIGEEKYTCSDCQNSYSVIISPTGHSFERTVTMPTLSDMGYTEFYCGACDYEYTGELRFYSDILPGAYANNDVVLAKGIDVSYFNYQKDTDGNYIPLDWDAIKAAGVQYVIIRAGYSAQSDGTFHIDETFELSYLGAKTAGLGVGVYFYTCARSVSDIEIEANLLLNLIKGKKFEYPIYLDLEDESYLNDEKTELYEIDAATLNKMCVKFFTILQRSGYYTGLYVNHNWLNNLIDTDEALSRFEIWYARYPETPENQAPTWNTEENGAHLGMWQYTDSGYIGETKFDFNYAYKNYPEIIKEGGFNGYGEKIRFTDSEKTYVVVTYDSSVRIRSKSDYYVTDEYDSNIDVITSVTKGSRFEVINRTESYAEIIYNGQTAYITANPVYVTFLEIK